jgi:hypothetical protein
MAAARLAIRCGHTPKIEDLKGFVKDEREREREREREIGFYSLRP